jgi:hypothetical protein
MTYSLLIFFLEAGTFGINRGFKIIKSPFADVRGFFYF